MAWPLDDRDIAIWLEKYNRAKIAFVRGAISDAEARNALADLRYRDEALLIEFREWVRFKQTRERKLKYKATKSLLEYQNARALTSPSSV